MSAALDNLSQKVHDELKAVAAKHPSFESFLQDMERLGEKIWHNARAQAESDVKDAATEAVADASAAVTGESSTPAAPAEDAATPSTTPAAS